MLIFWSYFPAMIFVTISCAVFALHQYLCNKAARRKELQYAYLAARDRQEEARQRQLYEEGQREQRIEIARQRAVMAFRQWETTHQTADQTKQERTAALSVYELWLKSPAYIRANPLNTEPE